MWSVWTNGSTHQNERKCDYIFQVCVGGGRRFNCRCDFSSKTTCWCCRRRSARGTSSAVWSAPPPLFSPLITVQQQQQTEMTFSLCSVHLLQSGLNWSCPGSSPVKSSCPIFRNSGLLTRWLTYSLSCLTCMCASIGFLACCFVLGTPHHMLQKRLSGRHAELLTARLSDVTSRQHRDGLMKELCERVVVILPMLHTHW